jgi:2,3-bisphosphoglycerate-dependent phosphoglycerate mutase
VPHGSGHSISSPTTGVRINRQLGQVGTPTYAQTQWADFSHKNPGGESLREVQDRNMQAVRTIIEDNLGSSVVIGTHGTALSTIMNHFNPDFGYDGFYRIIDRMPYILCFTLERTNLISVTEIEI